MPALPGPFLYLTGGFAILARGFEQRRRDAESGLLEAALAASLYFGIVVWSAYMALVSDEDWQPVELPEGAEPVSETIIRLRQGDRR